MSYGSYYPDEPLIAEPMSFGQNPLIKGVFNFLNMPFIRAAIYGATAGLGITTGYFLAKRPEKLYKGIGWTSFALSILLAIMAVGMLFQGVFPRA